MSRASTALPLPAVYYDGQLKDYYIANDRHRWIRINENSVKRHLKGQGYSALGPIGGGNFIAGPLFY